MAKIDYKKVYKSLYAPAAKGFEIIDVPELRYLMIDGAGNPNTSPEFKEKVAALYGLAYTIKFMISKADVKNDYVVPPLEGLWWCDDMNMFSAERKDEWKWRMLIMQPDMVSEEIFSDAMGAYMKKKKLTEKPAVTLQKFKEGKSAQILYYGSYANEAPVIREMHEFIRNAGYQLTGLHHEIYLSNPEKVAPEKLKTILRQPVK